MFRFWFYILILRVSHGVLRKTTNTWQRMCFCYNTLFPFFFFNHHPSHISTLHARITLNLSGYIVSSAIYVNLYLVVKKKLRKVFLLRQYHYCLFELLWMLMGKLLCSFMDHAWLLPTNQHPLIFSGEGYIQCFYYYFESWNIVAIKLSINFFIKSHDRLIYLVDFLTIAKCYCA